MLTKRTILTWAALCMGLSLPLAPSVGYATAKPKSASKIMAPAQSQLQKHFSKPLVQQSPQLRFKSAGSPSGASDKDKGSTAAQPRFAPVVAANRATLPHAAAAAQNLSGSAINTSKVASAIDGRKLNELSAIRMNDFGDKAAEIGKSRLDNQVRGVNSSTFKALDQLMPGFQDKAKGASSLQDMGSGGRNRNPVTDGHSLSNFIGDTTSTMGKGGKVTHHQDGSTTIKNKDGSTTDVWKDGTIVTQNKDGTTEVNRTNGTTDYYGKDGRKTGSTGISRNILDPSNPGYYTNGNKIDDSKGSGSTKGSKGGQQGEPVQDDGTSSGPHHVTSADLRGLAAKFGAAGEPTGDEGTSGGPVNESKTRNGRNGQVGQPVPDSIVAVSIPDQMQIKQALRVRLRNVTPVPDQ